MKNHKKGEKREKSLSTFCQHRLAILYHNNISNNPPRKYWRTILCLLSEPLFHFQQPLMWRYHFLEFIFATDQLQTKVGRMLINILFVFIQVLHYFGWPVYYKSFKSFHIFKNHHKICFPKNIRNSHIRWYAWLPPFKNRSEHLRQGLIFILLV